MLKWFSNLDVLSNTWALAGCFDVVWNGSRVKYAHWEHTQHYVYEIRVRVEGLLLKYYADSILTFAVQCEEDFRAAAMQLARDDPPMPWGLALVAALKDNNSIWDQRKDTLGPKIPRAGDQALSDAQPSGGGGKGAPLSRKAAKAAAKAR